MSLFPNPLTVQTKIILALGLFVICSTVFGGVVWTLKNKNDKIAQLERDLSALQIKNENLEKNARIDKLMKDLDLRLGRSLKDKKTLSDQTFSQIEKELEDSYSNAGNNESLKSKVLIDSIWNGFEATQ